MLFLCFARSLHVFALSCHWNRHQNFEFILICIDVRMWRICLVGVLLKIFRMGERMYNLFMHDLPHIRHVCVPSVALCVVSVLVGETKRLNFVAQRIHNLFSGCKAFPTKFIQTQNTILWKFHVLLCKIACLIGNFNFTSKI